MTGAERIAAEPRARVAARGIVSGQMYFTRWMTEAEAQKELNDRNSYITPLESWIEYEAPTTTGDAR